MQYAEKPRGRLRKAIAYALYLAAFLFAFAWLGGGQGAGRWLLCGLVSAGLGWAIMRGKHDPATAADAAKIKRQKAVLRLAAAEDGQLTVTEVAARLGWTLETALATMQSMEDGVRVTTTLTDEGIMLYDFPELIHDPGRRKRLR